MHWIATRSRFRPAGPTASRTAWILGLSLTAVALGGTTRAATEPSWSVTRAEVKVVCPLTVGGSFEAKTTSLSGTVSLQSANPPAFSGAISADLRSLETGIDLRDTHMRESYLGVDKGEGFERAVLSGIRLANVDPATFVGRTTFSGSFSLHGVTRPIGGQVEVRRSGEVVQLKARFPINLPDFGIPEPRYLGVGVKDRIEVRVSFTAAPLAPTAGGQ